MAKKRKSQRRPGWKREKPKVGEVLVLVPVDHGGDGRLDARHRFTPAQAGQTADELKERGYDPVKIVIGSILP